MQKFYCFFKAICGKKGKEGGKLTEKMILLYVFEALFLFLILLKKNRFILSQSISATIGMIRRGIIMLR
jgi:hypothetical protein